MYYFKGHHPIFKRKRSTDYIVDPTHPNRWGLEATPHEFPWMVLIHDGCHYSNLNPITSRSQTCGGVLITPSLVMSAKHCMECDPDGDNDVSYALLGVHEYNGYFTDSITNHIIEFFNGKPGYDVIPIVKRLFPHTEEPYHDFAMFVLERPAELSPRICPILLPNEDENIRSEAATVAGWGIYNNDEEKSMQLRKCDMTAGPIR